MSTKKKNCEDMLNAANHHNMSAMHNTVMFPYKAHFTTNLM